MRQSSGRVQARRPRQSGRQASGPVGLRLAGRLLESVRIGRAGDRLQVIGGAGWSWCAVGRLRRVVGVAGVKMYGQMQVFCGRRLA